MQPLVPEQHTKCLGNHWLQPLQLLDFVTLSEIIEIFKLTSEQGPVIEDVGFNGAFVSLFACLF